MSPAPDALPVKVVKVKFKKKGAPAYMVSFGDMMTLILCFFILLVSMSKERNYGLMAKGVGSFVMSVRSMGLTGILDAHDKQEIFEQMRRRFNLPPEPDLTRRAPSEDASAREILRAEVLEALKPHSQLRYPRVASFAAGSADLSAASREYLDRLADSLRPRPGQLLVLEGHDLDSQDPALSFRRAQAVREHLVEAQGFDGTRVEARAWLEELPTGGVQARAVDARLITPQTDR
jgi:chemotaxis protein MotB